MNKIEKICRWVKAMSIYYYGRLLPDTIEEDAKYLKILYRFRMKKELNLDNPQTFNEKLQWLKLYNRDPRYTVMVDKYAAKEYVAERIGWEHIIPTLGVWDRFDDIDFDKLPQRFVLKCTHDSGGIVICRDKSKLDMKAAKKKIEKSLKHNYYYSGREWPYKNVKPRIIAEQYIDDDIKDYKIFCFNGQPKMTLVCSERFSEEGLKEDFYDNEWNHLDIRRPQQMNADKILEKPHQFDSMKSIARKLSENTSFSRIDLYDIGDHIYFGEVTFFPASGLKGFVPAKWDQQLGEWIELTTEET